MSVRILESELAALGLAGALEARGKLAVLTLRDVRAVGDETVRAAAVALAIRHGFTNLALELDDGTDDRASLPGD